jgi:hypothetical protein
MSLDTVMTRVNDTVILSSDPSRFDSEWMKHEGFRQITPATYLYELTPTNEEGLGGFEWEPALEDMRRTFHADLQNDPWVDHRATRRAKQNRDRKVAAAQTIDTLFEMGIELQEQIHTIVGSLEQVHADENCAQLEEALIHLGEAKLGVDRMTENLQYVPSFLP